MKYLLAVITVVNMSPGIAHAFEMLTPQNIQERIDSTIDENTRNRFNNALSDDSIYIEIYDKNMKKTATAIGR